MPTTKKAFELTPELEGILLNLQVGETEKGLLLEEESQWILYEGYERKILKYRYKDVTYAYEKCRDRLRNGEYKHWTGEKAIYLHNNW